MRCSQRVETITSARKFSCHAVPIDKTARHEMCSSDHIRVYCDYYAGTRGPTTAFPGEILAAVYRGATIIGDGWIQHTAKQPSGYSGEITAVLVAKRRHSPA